MTLNSAPRQPTSLIAIMKVQMQIAKHIGRQEYDDAIRILKKTLVNDPENVASLTMIAQCHHWARRDEMAISMARQALSYAPNDFQILRLLSDIHFGRSEYDATAQFVRQGLANIPTPQQPPPKFMFWLLRLLSIVSPKYRKIEGTAKQTMADPNKDTKEWLKWAEQFLLWYDSSLKMGNR